MDKSVKIQNRLMNIAKAIGILAIVCSHLDLNIGGDFISSSAWHVPIFFFISGYFCSKVNSIENWSFLFKYLASKFCRYLRWFYFYNSFYAIITLVVYSCIGKYWGGLPNFKMLTYGAISYVQFGLAGPIWFLSQLAFSVVIFCLIIYLLKPLKNRNIIYAAIFTILAIVAIFLAKDDFAESYGIMKLIIRTFISLYYMYAGYLFKILFENKHIFTFYNFLLILLLQLMIITIYPNYVLSLSQARLYHNITPLICPLLGIYFVLFASNLFINIFKKECLIDKIGKNTLSIMCNHVFVIFLIQICLLKLFNQSLENAEIMTNTWELSDFKLLYIISGIFISVLIGMIFDKAFIFIKDFVTKRS